MPSRRLFVGQLGGFFLAGLSTHRLVALTIWGHHEPTPITVYKSSTCGCCTKWVDHLRANHFAPAIHDREDMDSLKDQLGVPAAMRSCHTAVADKYLIEGHVPAADIRRLLSKRPKVKGLAAPGMPAQSPGMAPEGSLPEGYDVLAFRADGTSEVFSRY
jgi:hypothetical protein